MKKFFIIFLALVMVVSLSEISLYSQMGIKAGINISTPVQSGSDIISLKWKTLTGFKIGAFYTLELNEYLAFQPEFYYSRKGGKLDETFFGVNAKRTQKIDYLEIPLLLKIMMPSPNSFVPHALAGIYGAFNINESGKTEVAGIGLEERIVDIKGFDFGLVLGLGVDIKLNTGILVVNLRYDLGLTNIADSITFISNSLKNRVVSILVGYGF